MKRLFCLVAVLAVGSLGLSVPAAAPADKEGLSKPIYMESIIETARVPMRDGETLFVEVRRPVVPAGVRVPVILTLSPYNDLSSPFPPEILGLTEGPPEIAGFFGDESLAKFFVPCGYARETAAAAGHRRRPGLVGVGGVGRSDGVGDRVAKGFLVAGGGIEPPTQRL